MHVAILSHEKGVELNGDPYELPFGTVEDVTVPEQREIVKQLVLTCINAQSRPYAFSSFRDGWPPGHPGKTMKNKSLEALLDTFLTKHPHLADAMCSDQGIRLMNLDSQIAERLIRVYTAAGTPILCIHDSFIVPYDQTKRLRRMMPRASLGTVGKELTVDSSETGPDEVTHRPRDWVLDFIHWRQLPRSPGYLQRLADHEASQEGQEGN